MRNKQNYIPPLIILLLLQTIALIGAWNLKLGIASGFLLLIVSIFLTFLTIIVYFLLLSERIPERYFRKKTEKEPEEPEKISAEMSPEKKEYSDPKIIAEQIFKNVLLKRNLSSFGEKILQNLAIEFDGIQGIFYFFNETENIFNPIAFYAILSRKDVKNFSPGAGIAGQAAMEEKITTLSNLPERYRLIKSGLGQGEPSFLYFIPFYTDKNCIALVEFSTFKEITEHGITVLNYLIKLGAKKLTQFRGKINE